MCDLCGHLEVSKDHLKRHIKALHSSGQNALYECGIYEYKSEWPSSIKDHREAKHEGLIFNCDQCDFKNSSSGHYIKQHKRQKHKEYKGI